MQASLIDLMFCQGETKNQPFFPFPPPALPPIHLKTHFEQALDKNKELEKKNSLTQACNVHHPLLLLVTRLLQAW
jgi:hypothetical protein